MNLWGIYRGEITNNQGQGANAGKVMVRLIDSGLPNGLSTWAPILTGMSGDRWGEYFLPAVNDEVFVAFNKGDINAPVVLGSIFTNNRKPPLAPAEAKDQRIVKSRTGLTILIDDANGRITISDSPNGDPTQAPDPEKQNQIVIDHKANSIAIQSQQTVAITAKGKLQIEADQLSFTCKGLTIDCSGEVKVKGAPFTVNNGNLQVS